MSGTRISWIPSKIHVKTTIDAHTFIFQSPEEPIPDDIHHIYLTGDKDSITLIHHGLELATITDKPTINKIIQCFSSSNKIDKNDQAFAEIVKTLTCLSKESFHYGFTFETSAQQQKNFYYYEKLPSETYTDSKKISITFSDHKSADHFQELLFNADFLEASRFIPSKPLQFVLNGSPSIAREFHAEISLSHHYTFSDRYEPIYFNGGHLYQVNYHYDIFSHDFSSEKMGWASLNFTSEKSAQAFLEGVALSNLNEVLRSLDNTDRVTQENAKNVKALFNCVDRDALAKHSFFKAKTPEIPTKEKSFYMSCVSK